MLSLLRSFGSDDPGQFVADNSSAETVNIAQGGAMDAEAQASANLLNATGGIVSTSGGAWNLEAAQSANALNAAAAAAAPGYNIAGPQYAVPGSFFTEPPASVAASSGDADLTVGLRSGLTAAQQQAMLHAVASSGDADLTVGLRSGLTAAQQQAMLHAVAPYSWVGSPEQQAALQEQDNATALLNASMLANAPGQAPTTAPATKSVTVISTTPGVASWVQGLASGLAAGGQQYTAQQLMTSLMQAMQSGKALTINPSLINAAKKPVKSSSGDWLIAAGIGVAVLAVFAVIAKGRQ
jgi:hypothetical protein